MNDTTWHIDDEHLATYAAGRLDAVRSSSAEAHLVTCDRCRRAVASLVDSHRTATIWSDIVDAVDAPPPSLVERTLRRLGMGEATARLLGATPSLQLSWLLAVTVALSFSVLAAQAGGDQTMATFLMVAPLLPLAGVAAAFGPAIDQTHEMTSATPSAGFRLLLLRATTVFSSTFVLASVASFGLPDVDALAAAWILPALALTLSSLAIATVVPLERAALGVAAAWLLTVSFAATKAHDWLVVFGAAGQMTFAVVIAIAASVLAWRRRVFYAPSR